MSNVTDMKAMFWNATSFSVGGSFAEMEKVRIGMTDSTFFICREVEVRIRSE